jgi:lysozyme
MSLDSANQLTLKNMLIQEEGYSQTIYKDSEGIWTAAIGRNLEARGISMSEALMMLDNDIQYFIEQLTKKIPFFKLLDEIRQIVLIDMAFNLGINRLLEFNNTLKAVEQADYATAAKEMLDSKWAKQVGRRAIRLSKMMETGKYCEL